MDLQMHFKLFDGLKPITIFQIKSFIILYVTFLVIIEGCQTEHKGGICTCHGYFFDEKANICKECLAGYFGRNCLRRCRYPGYGEQCQGECLCTTEYCDYRSGCVNIIENKTYIRAWDFSRKTGSRISISMFIKIFIIITAGIIFLFLLILTRMMIIHRKTKNTLTKANISNTIEGNDRNTMDDDVISLQVHGRNKKRNKGTGTNNTGVFKIMQTDTVKTHSYSTFASIRNEMLGDYAFQDYRRY
ncbi:uncharacterized protein LOC134233090 [Saccostrea cucullata]|uniref:uncharacterized protein LOC134233090 n=1 Tax=Saccostrea cuccullata TaxID=36930 RepID=UPI002ED4BB21